MQFIIFILVYPFIWLISILPLRVLYFFSDMFFVLIYYVFGYRKKVVSDNLKMAFPEKSEKERKFIQKKFYSHFVDIFVEMIKSFTISEKELNKRYVFSNIEVLNQLENEGKSVIIMGSHYANWEWIFIVNKFVKTSTLGHAAYTRINNKYFDKKIRQSRGRFGTKLVINSQIKKHFIANKKANILSFYGLLSDQSPQLHKTKYWSKFMGITVPIQTGSEHFAKQHDFAVVMMKTKKIKRGHFTTKFQLLAKKPSDFKNYEITDLFTKELEKQIREKPEHYFWSHRRFKHRGKEPIS